METISHKGPVTWSFDVFFDVSLNKRLSKQSRRRWFGTQLGSLCRYRNGRCGYCWKSTNWLWKNVYSMKTIVRKMVTLVQFFVCLICGHDHVIFSLSCIWCEIMCAGNNVDAYIREPDMIRLACHHYFVYKMAQTPSSDRYTGTHYMMTSSNGSIFHVTGHLCGEFTGPRWIPRTNASDAELWCFLWSASE